MNENYNRRKFPTLRKWSSGEMVITLQKRLCKHLNDLIKNEFIDGIFGPATEQQVRRFQHIEKLTVDGVVGRNTWTGLLAPQNERIPSPVGSTAKTTDRQRARNANNQWAGGSALAERVFRSLRRKNFEVYESEDSYHLNIIGVRKSSSRFNHFDDKIILVYRDENGKQIAEKYTFTTDPGSYYTKTRLLNEAGVAILIPGQYRNTYLLGKHRKKYEALVQRGGKVKVWRDNSRTNELNRGGRVYEGWFGINIHRARKTGITERIGSHSAGCQVFQRAEDFNLLIANAKKSAERGRKRFTYTLLEEADLS